ncbi:MAG: recombinase RecA [Burkholderiaceae bacterium]
MSASAPPPGFGLPDALQPQIWRASSLGHCASPGLPSGFAALDAELPGGGWPTRAISEILCPQFGVLEWRLLAPGLRALLTEPAPGAAQPGRRAAAKAPQAGRAARSLLLINPPFTPHLPGLRAEGLAPQRIIWIAPETAQQQLWATEQAIKANAAAAIVAWLPQARAEQIRRLQACALGSQAPVFLLRPWAAQAQSSAAPLRLLLTPGAAWSLDVHLLKRRGPAHAGWLSLPSVPAALAALLTPRMLALAPLPSRQAATVAATVTAPVPPAVPPALDPIAAAQAPLDPHALARPAAIPAALR